MPTFQFQETENKREFESPLNFFTYSFTQGFAYGEWQKEVGRKVRRFVVKKENSAVGCFQVIKYPLPWAGSLLYIPHGPILNFLPRNDFWSEFKTELKKILREEKSIFVRFDVFPPAAPPAGEFRSPAPEKTTSWMQPRGEWVLDLRNKTEEQLLSSMHQKTSYNVRLAEKKGVLVEIETTQITKHFPDFYKLLKKTSRRENFRLHPKNYYQNIFRLTETEHNSFLAIAKLEQEILAINLVVIFGTMAYFVFGGSADERRNTMFSYLLQWEAIREARRKDCAVYNFGGVGEIDNSGDPLAGVTLFKKKFGGQYLVYSQPADVVNRPFWYLLYNLRKKFKN